ncbi:hypothetical protein [Fluviispira vulneris]|uniref:hypothetical protein n=1 Tax=Fluviispira vulneris TaxID=2763012 RepID=UPI001644C276|nr:hypothetical protein [Fluviispira vulneris]
MKQILISITTKLIIMRSIISTYSFTKEGKQVPMQHYDVNRGNPHLKAQGKYIDKMSADFVERYKLLGIAMAIVQAPYIPRSAGYGLSSLTNDDLPSVRRRLKYLNAIIENIKIIPVTTYLIGGKENFLKKLERMISNFIIRKIEL